jgi:hypothetical protein
MTGGVIPAGPGDSVPSRLHPGEHFVPRAALPEITAVERLELKPGDTLVPHLADDVVNPEQAEEIQHRVREITGRPDLRVMVMSPGMDVEVISG